MTREAKIRQAKMDFDRDGFAVLRGFFSEQETQAFLANVQRGLVEIPPKLDPKHQLFEDKSRPETVLRLEKLHELDPAFKALLEGPLLQLVETVMGCPMIGQNAVMFGKAPRVGDQTPPHQAAFYLESESTRRGDGLARH